MTDPKQSAKEAGLRYVSCGGPGISRRRAGRGFTYIGPDGEHVTDEATLERIRSLAIPPAWRDVWICTSANGHLQATGRDDRGRRQYRYHPRWREVRDDVKYDRLIDFARALPKLRRRVRRDLRLRALPRDKVLATVVRLLDETWLRIGNVEYAKDNGSFGLTTLRSKHADVNGSTIRFRFRGKGGKRTEVTVDHPRVARVVRRCRQIPGYDLFQYLDEDGEAHNVESADVNDYLCSATGEHFTAKDFRTWAGTVATAEALVQIGPAASATEAKGNVVAAIDSAAEVLRDTRAVTRNSYVHPEIVEAYMDGSLLEVAERQASGRRKRAAGLRTDEALVLAVLLDRRRTRRSADRAA